MIFRSYVCLPEGISISLSVYVHVQLSNMHFLFQQVNCDNSNIYIHTYNQLLSIDVYYILIINYYQYMYTAYLLSITINICIYMYTIYAKKGIGV